MNNVKTLLLAIPIASFSLLLSGCKKKTEKLPVVEVEVVHKKDINIYGDYVGMIRASRSVEIHARVEGYLERMTFNEGKKVRIGEPLFFINDKVYKAKADRAKAQLEKDEAQLAKAERDLSRIQPLYQQNAASRLDLDDAIAANNIAKANVAMSKADLEQAQLELGYTVVRSPITGYMSERYADIGSLVGGSNSSLLASVVSRDTVLVDFKMTSLDYLRSQRRNVHLGVQDSTRSWQQTVEVTLADNTIYGEKGIVDFASPLVDPKTGTFGVRAELPNPNQVLLPGQFTRVKLLLDVIKDATVVPRKSLIIEKGGVFIFVIRPDSIAEKRFVETGYEQDNMVVVNRGLSSDEHIVTEGYQKLMHGQKVFPRTYSEEQKILEEKADQQNKEGGR